MTQLGLRHHTLHAYIPPHPAVKAMSAPEVICKYSDFKANMLYNLYSLLQKADRNYYLHPVVKKNVSYEANNKDWYIKGD